MGCCVSNSASERNRPTDDDILGRRKDVSCTDPVCCILFLFFIIGMILVTIYAYSLGDIRRISNFHDCYGNICGKEYNKKIFPNNLNSGINASGLPFVFNTYKFGLFGKTLCVKKCPDKKLATYTEIKKYAIKTGIKLCDYNVTVDQIDAKNHKKGLLVPTYYKSACAITPVNPQTDILGYCIDTAFVNKVKKAVNKSMNLKVAPRNMIINEIKPIIGNIISDFSNVWVDIVVLSGFALGISLIFLLLIRCLAFVAVYGIVFMTIVVSIGLAVFLWVMYANMKNVFDVEVLNAIEALIADTLSIDVVFYMAIALTVIALIIVLVIIFMWPRFRIVTKLFKEASKCMGQIPSIMLVPMTCFPLLGVFLAYWFVTAGFLLSVADARVRKTDGCIDYKTSTYSKYLMAYFIVGLVWISECVRGSQQMILAGIVAQWYFIKKNSNKTVTCALFKSWFRFWFQHSGSVVFGSLIITLVTLPRWLMMYIMKKMKKAESKIGPPTCCIKCIMGTCIGCLYCIEKCLKFINRNAYAVIAIEGISFCPAAVRAFNLMMSNFLRVAALNSLGDFILFLGKLCVAFLSGLLAMFWFIKRIDLNFYPLPVLVVAIVGFFFAHCILSIYETMLDILLICICVDEEATKNSRKSTDQTDSSVDSHGEMKRKFRKANTELNKISGRVENNGEENVEMQPTLA